MSERTVSGIDLQEMITRAWIDGLLQRRHVGASIVLLLLPALNGIQLLMQLVLMKFPRVHGLFVAGLGPWLPDYLVGNPSLRHCNG